MKGSLANTFLMNTHSRIHRLAYEVAASLDQYVSAHDFIFKESATIISFLKNLFGRGVQMEDLLSMVQPLKHDWERLLKEVHALKLKGVDSLSENESIYIDLLQKYVQSVQCAVLLLIDRQQLVLDIKLNGSNGPSLTDLQQMEAVYRNAVKEYVKIGGDLNRNAHLVAPWPRH